MPTVQMVRKKLGFFFCIRNHRNHSEICEVLFVSVPRGSIHHLAAFPFQAFQATQHHHSLLNLPDLTTLFASFKIHFHISSIPSKFFLHPFLLLFVSFPSRLTRRVVLVLFQVLSSLESIKPSSTLNQLPSLLRPACLSNLNMWMQSRRVRST